MTLMKLAELAGTSVATVSKAFSGSREISEETRERIYDIARREGCFDKYYKAPRTRPLVALLCPEPESEYYAKEIGILERALNARGADAVIAFTRFDPEREARLFRELAYQMNVDGVVIWGSGRLIQNVDELPLVALTAGETSPKNGDAVGRDTKGAMLRLVEIIKDYGHTEVGFIGEPLTLSKERLFKNAMRQVGLPVQDRYVVTSSRRFAEAGEDCMRELIERGQLPGVIVAAYDQIAYGAMRYAQEKGYRVPEDISFVGMDDISVTPYLGVPLSSIHVNLEDVCAQVVDLLFRRMENRHYRGRTRITIPVTVKLRDSLIRKK
ncbi:MAG: LacI family DNA-binding transcriptional regulator [Clostridia bacterium]|nr:LacI family DNA-binding transcriptional regulator [Clostridia bacterium]